jgi:hypothetical protein
VGAAAWGAGVAAGPQALKTMANTVKSANTASNFLDVMCFSSCWVPIWVMDWQTVLRFDP